MPTLESPQLVKQPKHAVYIYNVHRVVMFVSSATNIMSTWPWPAAMADGPYIHRCQVTDECKPVTFIGASHQ
jgi:hypothetical protein